MAAIAFCRFVVLASERFLEGQKATWTNVCLSVRLSSCGMYGKQARIHSAHLEGGRSSAGV